MSDTAIANMLENISNFLDERNQIERAKLAEMRAARWVHWCPGDNTPDTAELHTSRALSATQTADRLTAEALGEGSDE